MPPTATSPRPTRLSAFAESVLPIILTYKGPKQKADVKVRTELEIPLQPGDEAAADMTRLLTHLGYHFVAMVRKRRRTAP